MSQGNPPMNQAEEDALRAIREIITGGDRIKRLEEEINTANKLVSSLEKPAEQLKVLGLSQDLDERVLKLRLRGILSQKMGQLSGEKAEQHRSLELLRDLLKCPECRGQGSVTTSKYIRGENQIANLTSTNPCGSCGGTGLSRLSKETRESMERILKEKNK